MPRPRNEQHRLPQRDARLDADHLFFGQRVPDARRFGQKACDALHLPRHFVAGNGNDAPVRALMHDRVAQARIFGKLVFIAAHDGVFFGAPAHDVGKRLPAPEIIQRAQLRVDLVVRA